MAKETVFAILEGQGGILERAEVTFTPGRDRDEALNLALHEKIDTWTLSVGDTIKIRDRLTAEE